MGKFTKDEAEKRARALIDEINGKTNTPSKIKMPDFLNKLMRKNGSG